MIENLIVSGCSFTQGNQSWANVVAEDFAIKKLVNLATPAAGNCYIANSIIDKNRHEKEVCYVYGSLYIFIIM